MTSLLRSTTVGQKDRFMKFKDGNANDEEEEGFEGLEDAKAGNDSAFLEEIDADGNPISRDPPILCLSGLRHEDKGHVDGCGHSVASSIWIEEL